MENTDSPLRTQKESLFFSVSSNAEHLKFLLLLASVILVDFSYCTYCKIMQC